jgi:hypothetical protein
MLFRGDFLVKSRQMTQFRLILQFCVINLAVSRNDMFTQALPTASMPFEITCALRDGQYQGE